MKVTALIPDKLIHDVTTYAQGKNLTESITIALDDWVKLKHIMALNKELQTNPLDFDPDYSAAKARAVNRRR
ncbi:MAG TPA: DUF2191 domain-containing protein [Nitrospirales bacterium]|nr:DUF2191 domain-containing protein [Nitrospirales bacterium]HIA14544.1 DUF2191 domain-containing protein [Nitrospirales bacterium]HIB54721.1 DUF2191 domain-containing protein [Nitrospirales bacterium]HIN32408.1 DUF2191 domain-containing protein [Nitrospirales bacterium]HIO20874.1 DUF2191 domain-containing protein [Nitrospirales bacterium]